MTAAVPALSPSDVDDARSASTAISCFLEYMPPALTSLGEWQTVTLVYTVPIRTQPFGGQNEW